MIEKKKYIRPIITVYDVAIEYSIAAGSVAEIRYETESGFFESEWERTDLTKELEW
ncbi:MAG: hypothetical protein ACI35V_10450 [Sphingobacterium composti]|uniref:hypothetical protein n=1 Tax=Sphingobacterium composti TaxID=363260 RepID=UPI00135AACD5|nr:hypothetical protein [Sphingobacterium composti Ten et al. 2007 non Yoo et al. 2007]